MGVNGLKDQQGSGQKPQSRNSVQPAKTLCKRAEEWLASRGIGQLALAGMGLYSEPINRISLKLFFPYFVAGEDVGFKCRRVPEKDFYQNKGGCKYFYNLDSIQEDDDLVWIVEGEMDVLSFRQSGITCVISVPEGAPTKLSEEPVSPENDKKGKFAFFENSMPFLKGKKFVIAVDNDEPGMILREELVRRLQRGNCYVLTWPDDVKDANAYLMKFGAHDLYRYAWANFKEYPVRGLSSWGDVLPKPVEPLYAVRMPGLVWGDKFEPALNLTRGTISVVTGIPNHGKSAFVKHLAMEMVRHHNWRICFSSWEDVISTQLKPELIGIYSGVPGGEYIGDAEERLVEEAKQKLNENVCFIFDEGELEGKEGEMTVEWYIDIVKDAKRRFSIDMAILDPWTEMEHNFGKDLNETQYVGISLRNLRRLAANIGVHIMIVAHPRKVSEDGSAPALYDVSGSANWANRVDYGIVVHQPDFVDGQSDTEIHIRKLKRSNFGRRGVYTLGFDAGAKRYTLPGA